MKFPVTRVKRSPNVADLHGRLGKLGGRATWWYFQTLRHAYLPLLGLPTCLHLLKPVVETITRHTAYLPPRLRLEVL